MLHRGNASKATIPYVSKFRERVDKSFLVCSVLAGYSDFSPAVRKAFQVLVLHVSVMFHLLGPIDGGFIMDGSDGITEV